jgi:hypothetical protein
MFGTPGALGVPGWHAALRAAFPRAHFAGCSSAGDISGRGVTDDSIVVTAIRFQTAAFRVASVPLDVAGDAAAAGRALARSIAFPGLRHVVVFSQGVGVNGSDLIAGIGAELGKDVGISGGRAMPGHSRVPGS